MLVVVGIVSLLAGIIVPVLKSAKLAAKKTTAINNLHQCFVAMQLYAPEEEFPKCLPNKALLEPYLGPEITCDPADHWRTGCTAPSTPFTVGSFGYVRTVGGYSDDAEWASRCRVASVPLLASPFYSGNLPRINFNTTQDLDWSRLEDYKLQPRYLSLWQGGEIGMSKLGSLFEGELFRWDAVFVQMDVRGH